MSDIGIILCVMGAVFTVAFGISAAVRHYHWKDYEKRQDEIRRFMGRK